MIKSYSYYFVGSLVGRVASIILLPIYTSYLTPADYGVLELLSMMLVLASIIFGDRVGQAFFREWGCAENEEEKRFAYGNALAISFALSATGTLVLLLFSGYLSLLQFGSRDFTFMIQVFSLNLVLNVLRGGALSCLRAMDKPGLYLFFSLALLSAQISFNLLALVKLKLGLSGVVYASVLSAFVVTFVANIYVWWKTRPLFSWARARQMVGFSVPIILAGMFMYIVVYGDRYFLRISAGLDEVGVYALGYKFGFILFSMIWGPFMQAWDSEKYKIYKDEDKHDLYSYIFQAMYLVLMLCGLGMVFWVDDFLYFASDEKFHSAYLVVPVIMIAYFIFAITDFINFGILVQAKTGLFGYAAVYTAIVSVVLYLILIPSYGMLGAAWATVLSFLFRFVYLKSKSDRLFNMQLDYRRLLGDTVFVLVIGGGYLALRTGSPDLLLSFLFSLGSIISIFLRGIVPFKQIINYSRGDKSIR